MKSRRTNASFELARRARGIVEPFTAEVGKLNEEAAHLFAIRLRPKLTDADGRDLLLRTTAVETALMRIEHQLAGALVGQPSDIVQHGRVLDLHAAIAAVRKRLSE